MRDDLSAPRPRHLEARPADLRTPAHLDRAASAALPPHAADRGDGGVTRPVARMEQAKSGFSYATQQPPDFAALHPGYLLGARAVTTHVAAFSLTPSGPSMGAASADRTAGSAAARSSGFSRRILPSAPAREQTASIVSRSPLPTCSSWAVIWIDPKTRALQNAAHAVGVGERERAGRVRIISGLQQQMSGRGPERQDVERVFLQRSPANEGEAPIRPQAATNVDERRNGVGERTSRRTAKKRRRTRRFRMRTAGHLLGRTSRARSFAAARRAKASAAADRSIPTTVPSGATSKGKVERGLTSATADVQDALTRAAAQAPPKRGDQVERVAVPAAPAPPPMRGPVLRPGSAPARGCSGPCGDHCLTLWECRATVARMDHSAIELLVRNNEPGFRFTSFGTTASARTQREECDRQGLRP